MKYSLKTTLLFFVCLMLLPFAYAQVPPLNVHQFYGDVINGQDGDVVKAVVNGNDFTTTVSDGKYGYDPTFNVEGGTTGDDVIFYINNVEVATTAYNEQGLTELDLTKPVTAPPSTGNGGAPSGGGGGGGGGSFWQAYTGSQTGGQQQCVEDWVCGSWSGCTPAGQKLRECVDQEACGTELLRPVEVMVCEVENVTVPEPITPPLPKPKPVEPLVVEEKGLGWLWLPIILIIILVLVGVGFFVFSYLIREKEVGFKPPVIKKSTDRLSSLRDYVAKTRGMGYNSAQIRQVLIKAGWNTNDINKVLGISRAAPIKAVRSMRTSPVRTTSVKRTRPRKAC